MSVRRSSRFHAYPNGGYAFTFLQAIGFLDFVVQKPFLDEVKEIRGELGRRFTIIKNIGHGALAQVSFAIDMFDPTLGRKVALKMVGFFQCE